MALSFGCGGGSGTDEGANTGTVAPGTGASGSPAASGGGGTPGAGMIPGVMMSTVACGTATCQGFMFGGMGATPCCADEAMSTCGTMMGATCMAKPAIAEKCPKIPPVFGMQVNSCCQANGTCGVDGSALGRGCGPYSGLAMFMVTVPETMCDGTPIASAGAAGSSAGAAGASAGAAGAAGASTGAAGGGAAGGGAAAAGSSASAGGAGKAAAGTSGGTAGSTSSSSGSAGKAGSAASAGAGGR